MHGDRAEGERVDEFGDVTRARGGHGHVLNGGLCVDCGSVKFETLKKKTEVFQKIGWEDVDVNVNVQV